MSDSSSGRTQSAVLSLKELLDRFTPEQMEALSKELHLKPGAEDRTRLLQRLNNSERTRKIFSELEPTEKHVLRFLLSQGGRAEEQDLLNRFPDAPPALAKLRGRYLVFDDPRALSQPALCIPREYQRFISLAPAEKTTLANLFLQQPSAYHADLARMHGWTLAAKHQAGDALKRKWLDEPRLKSALETLPDPEKSLWHQLIDADGIIDSKTLQSLGIANVTVQPGHLDFARPLEALYARGLVFPNKLPHPACFIVPSDILTLLKGKTVRRVFSPSGNAPAHLRAWGLRLLSDLQLFAAYQTSGRLQFTHHDIPLRHQLRAFMKALGAPEENYGLFLNVSFEAFFGQVIKRIFPMLNADPAESMSRIIVHWREGQSWQESAEWRDVHRSPDGLLDQSLKAKRLIVLKALEELPVQQWVLYKEFEEAVFTTGWKRVDSGIHAANIYDQPERWPRRGFKPDLSAQDTLANLTAENLVWMGLVDVGIGKPRKTGWDITHVRLTEWGRQFLDKKSGRLEPLPAVKAETQFRVLPNLDISASSYLRPDLLAGLFKLAVLKGVNSFSLTKNSLREALDEGMTQDDILNFLKTHSAQDLPGAVHQFIEETAQKHGHIKLGIAGAYLQVDDPMLLIELRAHRTLKDIFRKQVGDKLAILNDKDLDRTAKVLRKKGYFPIIEKSDETDRLKAKYRW